MPILDELKQKSRIEAMKSNSPNPAETEKECYIKELENFIIENNAIIISVKMAKKKLSEVLGVEV